MSRVQRIGECLGFLAPHCFELGVVSQHSFRALDVRLASQGLGNGHLQGIRLVDVRQVERHTGRREEVTQQLVALRTHARGRAAVDANTILPEQRHLSVVVDHVGVGVGCVQLSSQTFLLCLQDFFHCYRHVVTDDSTREQSGQSLSTDLLDELHQSRVEVVRNLLTVLQRDCLAFTNRRLAVVDALRGRLNRRE